MSKSQANRTIGGFLAARYKLVFLENLGSWFSSTKGSQAGIFCTSGRRDIGLPVSPIIVPTPILASRLPQYHKNLLYTLKPMIATQPFWPPFPLNSSSSLSSPLEATQSLYNPVALTISLLSVPSPVLLTMLSLFSTPSYPLSHRQPWGKSIPLSCVQSTSFSFQSRDSSRCPLSYLQ